MKEFLKSIVIGIISGLIVLAFTWYVSDSRDNLKIGIKVDALEKEHDKLSNRVDGLEQRINTLSDQFARIDERTKIGPYNEKNLNQISQDKKIPQIKIDSAKHYLSSKPNIKDAIDYLETNLGFSLDEAKAVISKPRKN